MAEEEDFEGSSGGGGKGLIIVLIALILILLIAVGVGGYLLYSKGAFSDQPPAPADGAAPQTEQAVKKVSSSNDMGPTINVAIEDLILNITTAKGREKLMKLSFTLKCGYDGCESLIEQVKPEIQDAVISQTSSRSVEELLTVGGKALFKEELLDEINAIINEETKTNEDIRQNIIRQIYFTTFVIK